MKFKTKYLWLAAFTAMFVTWAVRVTARHHTFIPGPPAQVISMNPDTNGEVFPGYAVQSNQWGYWSISLGRPHDTGGGEGRMCSEKWFGDEGRALATIRAKEIYDNEQRIERELIEAQERERTNNRYHDGPWITPK